MLSRSISDRQAAELQSIASRLGALTDRFDAYVAQQCDRMTLLLDSSSGANGQGDRWEQERRQLIAQLQQERELITEAWERLEREQRRLLSRQHSLDTSYQERTPRQIKELAPAELVPATTSAVDAQPANHAGFSASIQFRQLRQEINRHTNRNE